MKLKVRHRRPSVLSDPYFDNSDERLRRILQTPDAELNWFDFKTILGPYLPAGTYEEAVYFLPLAIKKLLVDEENALDLVTSPIWFISEHYYELDQDGLLHDARSDLEDCFLTWLSEFQVSDYYVRHQDLICQGIEDLVRFQKLGNLAASLFSRLVHHHDDPIKAAWLLEFARLNVEGTPYAIPPQPVFQDREELESALDVVRKSGLDVKTLHDYWENLAWIIAAIP